ncbi:MAG: PRTRC system protein C [Promethearchaeota archaeon]|jgi:PRTRC genetic system protein C
MALESSKLERVFKYEDTVLPDPDPNMAPKEVMNFYSGQYPELTTASIDGPKIENDQTVYTFGKSVGTKG